MPRLSLARRTLIMLAAAAAVSSVAAHAQHSAPLHVILPLSPGSGVDVITRSAQEALSRAFDGQSVVIENRPGSGGVIGTQALVRARPDGTTVGIISNNHSVNPAVLKNLPYDSLADVTPISIIGGSPFIFVVNPDKVPARTAAELQAYLKTRPNELNFGSAGNGTIIHLAGEMFLQAAGVQADHIPYRGTGPMVVDLLGGQIEMGVASLDAVQGHLRSGKLHAIGVMGRQRLKSMPEIPTFVEQGFPDVDVAGWFAVVGPKGLPAEHVQRIHAGFVKAFNDPQVQAGFASRDNFLMLNTPEQAADFLRTEQSRYAELVRRGNITVD